MFLRFFGQIRAFLVRRSVRRHFKEIYEKNLFGGVESRSGTGSSLIQTTQLRAELPILFEKLRVRSVLDAPCGDCNWIDKLNWASIKYYGADVVPALIEAVRSRVGENGMQFFLADLCKDDLPSADLILCRDCWVHLTYDQARDCLNNFKRSGAAYLLVTTFPSVDCNQDLGQIIWRPLNLQLPPFSFPSPMELVVENCTEDGGKYADKALGLWRLSDLSFCRE